MLKYLIAFLLMFSFFNSKAQSGSIEQFYKDNSLDTNQSYTLMYINTNYCKNCISAMNFMQNSALNHNLIYVLSGLRKAEVNYYSVNELKLNMAKSRIILDNDFAKKFNSDFSSEVYDISFHHILKNEVNTPHLNEATIKITDSLVLKTSPDLPLSLFSNIYVLPNKNYLVYDSKYNNFQIYDSNGKIVKTWKPSDSLGIELSHQNFLKTASERKYYTDSFLPNMDQLNKYGFNLIDIVNVTLDSAGNIFGILGVMMPRTESSIKNAVGKKYLLVSFTPELNFKTIGVLNPTDPFYPNPFFSFQIVNKYVYYGVAPNSNPKDSIAPNNRFYIARQELLNMKKSSIVKAVLPDFFEKNKLYYYFIQNNLVEYNNNLLSYFGLMPVIQNLNTNQTISITGTPISNFQFEGALQRPIIWQNYLMFTQKNELCMIQGENDKFYFSQVSADGRQLKKRVLQIVRRPLNFYYKDSTLYSLSINDDAVTIYWYKL